MTTVHCDDSLRELGSPLKARLDEPMPMSYTRELGPMKLRNRLDKHREVDHAISQIVDGATVMIGGFGNPGTPFGLIEELVRQGQSGLTIIKNDANAAGIGIDRLLTNGQVDRLITSHIGLNPNAVSMMNSGQLIVEFVAQGILAERIRAAGAGLLGIATDIGLATELSEGRTSVSIDGKRGIIEASLHADFALVHAATADAFGNLVFEATARNFSPLMSMAASVTIVEAEQIVELGGIDPDHVHLSGVFVDDIVLQSTPPEAIDVSI